MRRCWKGIAIGTLLAVVLLTGCTPLRAQPHTYREAIVRVLDARAIAYRDVQVGDGCQPNPSDCLAISVTVITASLSVSGWIACQRYHEACSIWLPALGIHDTALPALAQDPRWLRALNRYLRTFGASIQAISAPLR
jgi:hypothetical protein